LNKENHTKLMNVALDTIGAFPTRAIITTDGGHTFIRGVPLNGERARVVRESAQQALQNVALQIVHDEVLYRSVANTLHTAVNFEGVQFGKASVWYGQQERELLKILAQEESRELLA
jgi:hypothetical protein